MRRAVLFLLLVAACRAPYDRRVEDFRVRYEDGDFEGAARAIDKVIRKEARVRHARDANPRKRDTYLLLLEKAMTLLALDEPEPSIQLMRRSRDVLDDKQARSVADYFAAVLSDDRALDYQGADYEHILVRVMLCLADLTVHSSQTGGDAYAYALQIGEKQAEILDSTLGAEVEYEPRKKYKRVGIGAYLQGVILEATGAADGAAKAYERCTKYEPAFRLGRAAFLRAMTEPYAPAGEGVIHVFWLAGAGPIYREGSSPPTDLALRIAELTAAILLDSPVPLFQADVPVPVPVLFGERIEPLPVRAAGRSTRTELLLDVNEVAVQQIKAMMPMILARAVLRRSVKTAATTAGAEATKRGRNHGDRGLIDLGFGLANLWWTSAERADTRLWTSLPAEIQAARLTVPQGDHDLQLGGLTVPIRVAAGKDSYVVVIQPNLAAPAAVILDRWSRIAP